MWWLLALFMSIAVSMFSFYDSHSITAQTALTVTTQQQAMQTVAYLNAINDYLYDNPMSDGSVPDEDLPVTAPKNTANVISGNRVFVYQPPTTGLMYQLEKASTASALIGKVASGRLLDATGTDMGVTVPSAIPDGDIVYLN